MILIDYISQMYGFVKMVLIDYISQMYSFAK